jgi:hypothetical protein
MKSPLVQEINDLQKHVAAEKARLEEFIASIAPKIEHAERKIVLFMENLLPHEKAEIDPPVAPPVADAPADA